MKYWVFDLDGTLVNSLTNHFEILKVIFNKYDREFTRQDELDALNTSGVAFPKYLETKLGVANAGPALIDFDEMNQQRMHHIHIFENMIDVLDELKARGATIALWTARDRGTTLQILENTKLNSYLKYYVTANCVEKTKPHAEGLEKIMAHFNCKASDVVMVGDHNNDMIPAHQLGAYPIRVDWNRVHVGENCTWSKHRFDQVNDFRSWIQTSNSMRFSI